MDIGVNHYWFITTANKQNIEKQTNKQKNIGADEVLLT